MQFLNLINQSEDNMKHGRLVELIVLFVGVPFVLAVCLPPRALYPVLAVSAVVGIIMLHFTRGFRWRELFGAFRWSEILALGVATFLASSFFCWLILPERLWFLLIQAPQVMLWIAIVYQIVQVVPQELIYRALFFGRYGNMFSSRKQAIFVNALLFTFGHLMYWHPIVFIASFFGSVIFSNAYFRPRGFMQACALHGIAGNAIFASGLGWLFYSGGNVAQ